MPGLQPDRPQPGRQGRAFLKIIVAAGFADEQPIGKKRRKRKPKSALEGAPEGSMIDPFGRKDATTLSTILARRKIQMRWNLRASRVEVREPRIAADDGVWEAATDIIMDRTRDDILTNYYVRTTRGPTALNYGRESWKTSVNACISHHQVDPFKEWLMDLPEWDGESVIDGLLPALFGAADDALSRWAGRYLFLGVVERAFSPGSQQDEIPVLIGPQGIGKSALLRAILPPAMPELFGDSLRFDASPGHQVDAVLGKAVIEVSEMAGRSKADIEAVKAFVSRRNDNGVRRPYASYTAEQPRRFILCGTTNNENDLPNDSGGNRRFVAVVLGKPVGAVEEYIDRVREQAWAEAVYLHLGGESARLPREVMPMQAARAEEHRDRDDLIEDAISALPSIKATLTEVIDMLPERLRTMSEHRIGRALKKCWVVNGASAL